MADDKETTMTIRIDSDRMLSLLGDNGERWMQGGWGDDTRMCLHGAIRRCQPQPGDAFLIEQVARRQGWGTAWNDDTSTSWQMVRERLDRIEVTDGDLADTFGAQWEPIVALVRRVAVLTNVECQLLAAAGAAAGDAARAAAGAAAGDAAWAAWAAAWAAARAVALALVTRDLIGQHGYTQTHYDAMTLPWATVIGPAHPDDEKARRG